MGFWRKEFSQEDIDYIFDHVKKFRKVSLSKNVTLTGPAVSQASEALLVSAIGIDLRTNSIRKKIVRDALFSPKLPENFTEKEFRNIVYKLRNLYESVEKRKYFVAFPIWNKPAFLSGIMKVDNVTLNFSPSKSTRLYKKVVGERYAQMSEIDFSFKFGDEIKSEIGKCALCLASVNANSHQEANERASDSLYQILGLVNLTRDSGKYWRISMNPKGTFPVSDVLIAPHTTSHNSDGTLTHQGFWSEEWRCGQLVKNLSSQNLVAWEKQFGTLKRGVENSSWRKECALAAAQYFKAFSNPDLLDSFLDGWRLFESISGSQYEKIADQITRVSNVYDNQIEPRIIGKHLALRRNLITHGRTIETGEYEVIAFQMLQFINPFMQHFILNGFSFKSLQDFWSFLSLPPSKIDRNVKQIGLENELDLLKKAAQFRGEIPKDL